MSADRDRAPERLANAITALGRVIVDDERAADIEREQKRAAALRERTMRAERLEQERVPLPDADLDLVIAGTLKPTLAARAVRRWMSLASAPRLLMLHGVSGSGKSLAAALAIAMADGGRWTSSLRLLAAYASWYGEAAAAQVRFEACPLLVVDDLGREPIAQAPRMATALLELIDARPRRRTVITTRMLPDALEKRYVLEALKSRVASIGSHIVLPEEDLRPRPEGNT